MSLARIAARIAGRTVTVAAAAALVAGAARPAAAQERILFSWQGRVDREASLAMRESRVTAPGGFYGMGSRGDLRVGSPLPQADGVVRVRVERGRGAVDVVEQPSSGNDYTAVVRVRDEQNGADDYRITAYWQPRYGSVASGDDRGGRDDRGGWDDRRGRDDRGSRDDRGGWDDRGDGRGGRDDRGGWEARGEDRGRGNGRGRGRGNGRDRRDDRRDRRDDRRDDRRAGRDDRGGWGNGGYGDGGSSSGVLRWSGRVDGVQEIRVRGRRADSYAVSGAGAADVRSRVDGAIGRDARVRVLRADGRGQVQVVQQPSSANDYTAVLRIVDRQAGASYYDVEASW
jgi:hypothetical protein